MSDLDTLFEEVNPREKTIEKTLKHEFQLIARGHGPYREKYRPMRLSEVVPTCSVELLRNQLNNPNASQIYLFEGESGTGKTTCARILAKAKICQGPDNVEKPCLNCNNCKSFDTSFDKTELNAANQNRIEDIRNMVEDMRYGPAVYSKKIYILDEVQRLTAAAQQVLLTELEEPYSYLLVFLCTTDIKEINKALADRACRVNFGKIGVGHARDAIDQILANEKLTASDDIIESLYHHSHGSIRALLNNIQAYAEKGYNPEVWPEDEVSEDVAHLFKLITAGDWANLSKALTKSDVRKQPEAFRMGLENYFRAVILKTSSLPQASKLGEGLLRLLGTLINYPSVTQYNEFVLKCLRAAAVFKRAE